MMQVEELEVVKESLWRRICKTGIEIPEEDWHEIWAKSVVDVGRLYRPRRITNIGGIEDGFSESV